MRTNDFLANMAKAAFAFAAALMMSMAFTACSGNDDDDNGGGGEDTSQTIMLDGVEKTVDRVVLTDYRNNDYTLRFYLSGNNNDFLSIDGNTARYNGKTIDLTKVEEDTDAYEWSVTWKDKGTYRFSGYGGRSSLLFKTGTMKITVDLNTGDYDVTIVNGKVHNEKDKWNDGSEHTVSVKWKGKATVDK